MTSAAPHRNSRSSGSLRIAVVCPAPPGSRLGNRVTALRWERIFRELGHEVVMDTADGEVDLLVALHAGKSASAVRASRARFPARPIVVALTGTDLYPDIDADPRVRESLDVADRIVVLHDLAPLDVPPELRSKTRVVRQSADAVASAPAHEREGWDVAFVAHARREKDPLRAALAARALPPSSRIRVVHAGRALSDDTEALLRREAAENARYAWLGEVSPDESRALIARSKLLVLTSEIEGGANVLGEAIVAGTPPIATRIPASVAALGADYPGLFRVGDTASLTHLLARAESDRAFYDQLVAATAARRHLFAVSAERDAWRAILTEITAR